MLTLLLVVIVACSSSPAGGPSRGGQEGGGAGFGGGAAGFGGIAGSFAGRGGTSGARGGTGGGFGSCVGHCGASTPAPGSVPPCFCDDACQSSNDCCPDKVGACGSSGSGGAGFGGVGGVGGSGVCSQASCKNGCCDSSGKCVEGGQQTDAACGRQGAACFDCTKVGSVCGYNSCKECKPDCVGKTCGAADGCGGLCKGACPKGRFCGVGHLGQPGQCLPCNAQTCEGCCTADGKCESGAKRTACGNKGQLCQDCGAQACNVKQVGSAYYGSCGPCGQSCKANKCKSDGCGKLCPGASCSQASGPQECRLQPSGLALCVSSEFCSPAACPSGCCDYSSSSKGTCLTGNLPSACGTKGATCVNCVAKGSSCDVASQTCANCKPSCNSMSCGQDDGCGGVCTGSKGGVCDQGVHDPSMECTEQGACACPATKSTQCYNAALARNECVDSLSNPGHCGGCGNKCPAGVACKGGICQCPAGSLFCKGSSGQSGVCTNIGDDPKHCGSCAKVCATGKCVAGQCVACAVGKTACAQPAPGCFDLLADVAHCGACNNPCPVGVACKQGKCQCSGGKTACGGVCLDILTDPKNCGACGNQCPTGVSCAQGKCQCPFGTTLCGGVCTNTDVDPKNCGTCNVACLGATCNKGKCL